MTDEQKAKCIAIAEHYDYVTQGTKLIEEMAELTQAICKGYADAITEEIADVYIMLYQVVYLIAEDKADGVVEDNIHKQIDYKLNRQLERIAAEKSAATDCAWR